MVGGLCARMGLRRTVEAGRTRRPPAEVKLMGFCGRSSRCYRQCYSLGTSSTKKIEHCESSDSASLAKYRSATNSTITMTTDYTPAAEILAAYVC